MNILTGPSRDIKKHHRVPISYTSFLHHGNNISQEVGTPSAWILNEETHAAFMSPELEPSSAKPSTTADDHRPASRKYVLISHRVSFRIICYAAKVD